MLLEAGDRVRHPARPDWGPGEVLALSGDGKLTIYFAMVGQKTLKGIALEKVTGPDASHPLLEHRIRSHSRGVKTRVMADLKAAFLRLFPGSFRDPHYLDTERDYKIAGSDLLAHTLASTEFHPLLAGGDHPEICRRALAIVNATNLIFPNEKMDLKDGLSRVDAPEEFAHRLNDLLYGPGSFESRFEAFADVLERIGAAKWTIATYFPFLAFREQHMFLKPVVTQQAAEACDFELHYRSELNYRTYEALLHFCDCLRTEVVADLGPRDMVDLQSFVWCIGERI
jgi:Protein of unknown function (DUF3553)